MGSDGSARGSGASSLRVDADGAGQGTAGPVAGVGGAGGGGADGAGQGTAGRVGSGGGAGGGADGARQGAAGWVAGVGGAGGGAGQGAGLGAGDGWAPCVMGGGVTDHCGSESGAVVGSAGAGSAGAGAAGADSAGAGAWAAACAVVVARRRYQEVVARLSRLWGGGGSASLPVGADDVGQDTAGQVRVGDADGAGQGTTGVEGARQSTTGSVYGGTLGARHVTARRVAGVGGAGVCGADGAGQSTTGLVAGGGGAGVCGADGAGQGTAGQSNKPYILSILSYMHVIYENIHKRVFCYARAGGSGYSGT